MKKKQPSPADVNPSTLKSRNRQALLDAVARRLVNDPTASWSDAGTAFRQALLAEKWNDDLTEAGIRECISGVLFDFAENNRKAEESRIKSPADMKAALLASRGKRGRKY